MALFTPEQEARIRQIFQEEKKVVTIPSVERPIDPPDGDPWHKPWDPPAEVDEPKMTTADVSECIDRAHRGVGWAGNRFGGHAVHRAEVDELAYLKPKEWAATSWAQYNVDRNLVFVLILDGTIKVKTQDGQPPTPASYYENMTLEGWLEGNLGITGVPGGGDPV